MKNAYYFSHDGNARNDSKILMLRADHGWQGYGIYWVLVEIMFESSDTAIDHKSIKAIALANNIKITLLESVINTCINERLFVSDDETFWSDSLRKRKETFEDLKAKKSSSGKKGMESRWNKIDSAVITPLYQNDNTVISNHNKESKVKEIKEIKESKVEKAKKMKQDLSIDFEFIPDYIRPEILGFIAYRKSIKAPMNQHAVELLLKELFKLSGDGRDQKAILNQSILNNWKGVFPLKNGNVKSQSMAQGFEEALNELR